MVQTETAISEEKLKEVKDHFKSVLKNVQEQVDGNTKQLVNYETKF